MRSLSGGEAMLRWTGGAVLALSLAVALGCGARPTMPVIRRDREQAETPSPTVVTTAPRVDRSASPQAEFSAASAAPSLLPQPASARPPQMALSDDQRQRGAQLSEIGAALLAYAQDRGRFPAYAVFDADNKGVLSWRVELLPYLGQQGLYQKFELALSWDNRQNRRLLSNMPEIFRTEEADHALTPFRLVNGRGTCFSDKSGTSLEAITDGLDRTIILIEAPPQHAREWTAPGDIRYDQLPHLLQESAAGLLALWADGRVGLIPKNVPPRRLLDATTIDGGERSNLWESAIAVSGPATPEAVAAALSRSRAAPAGDAQRAAARSGEDSPLPGAAVGADAPSANTTAAPRSPGGSRPPQVVPSDRQLAPVPSQHEQDRAAKLVRELFLQGYQDAATLRERQLVAKEMLEKSSKLGDDLAGKYVMLATAQRIALEIGDIETAAAALQSLIDAFEFDAYEMKVQFLRKTSSLSGRSSFDVKVMDEAVILVEEAVQRDDYAVAAAMAEAALAAARRLNSKHDAIQLVRRQREVEKMAATYRKVQTALDRVGGNASADPEVSEAVGRYYCLLKGDWQQGLPFLARAADPDLCRLAQRDAQSPADAQAQLELADGWWNESQQAKPSEDEQLRRRAAHWYTAALESLPQGLVRLKAELRLKELQQSGESLP